MWRSRQERTKTFAIKTPKHCHTNLKIKMFVEIYVSKIVYIRKRVGIIQVFQFLLTCCKFEGRNDQGQQPTGGWCSGSLGTWKEAHPGWFSGKKETKFLWCPYTTRGPYFASTLRQNKKKMYAELYSLNFPVLPNLLYMLRRKSNKTLIKYNKLSYKI